MSRIVALLNRDRRPAELAVLRQLAEPLRGIAREPPRFLARGAVGLAYQCLHEYSNPDENQPGELGSDLSVCFDGRLDNREELILELRLELGADPAGLPDSHLVMACYRRFGDQFAARLNGDYALALFDAQRHQLLLARDVMGVRPLYYWESRRTFLAASEIKAILAHPEVDARPDDDALADLLVGGDPNERRLTLFRDVRRVLPGHTVIVTHETIRELQHWDFDPMLKVCCNSPGEYAEQLRILFEQAVRRRLRSSGPVAITVSGGLDSSSILCQAEALRKAGAPVPAVHGISRLYPEGSPADERRYLAAIESHLGVDIRRLPSRPLRFSDAPAWLWRLESPALLSNHETDCLEAARELSCTTLLDGYLGDQFLSSHAHLYERLRAFRWIAARREFLALAGSMTDCTPGELLRDLLRPFLRDLVPEGFMRPIRGIRRLTGLDRSVQWFSPGFRDIAYRRGRQRRRTFPFSGYHAALCYRSVHAPHVTTGLEWSNKLAASYGLDRAYPFADRDLVAFLMAIPGEVVALNGIYKGLFREAMRGVLPEPVRLRYSKADFTLVESDAIAAALDSRGLEDLSRPDSLAIGLGYLDPTAMPALVARKRARLAGRSAMPAFQLNTLLALESWLQVFFSGKLSAEGQTLYDLP